MPRIISEHRPERAWTGSVILAGDYCLSRSALLVAKTNVPQVVDIFADALKTVNEEMLRRLFATAAGASVALFEEDEELVHAGLRAATVLAGWDEQAALAVIEFGQKLFKHFATESSSTRPLEPPFWLLAFPHSRWPDFFKTIPSQWRALAKPLARNCAFAKPGV
ncbi:MAG: hypothetical protein HC936_15985 [Leptolyngbyaceae cyanobacterium SU_3_3]|nr:hypothetical protein [Leptolyngbyaceae cyanobacterium SU_3_3]